MVVDGHYGICGSVRSAMSRTINLSPSEDANGCRLPPVARSGAVVSRFCGLGALQWTVVEHQTMWVWSMVSPSAASRVYLSAACAPFSLRVKSQNGLDGFVRRQHRHDPRSALALFPLPQAAAERSPHWTISVALANAYALRSSTLTIPSRDNGTR